MMNIRDQVEYKHKAGSKSEPKLRVFALSTCAFCEKAMSWLTSQDYAFDFLFLDEIEPDQKKALKIELKAAFGPIPVFPVLTINDKGMVAGFTEEKWEAAIGN